MRSTELGTVEEAISRSLFDHQLSTTSTRADLDAWIWTDEIDSTLISDVTLGTEVRLEPVNPAACVVIVLPFAGSSLVQRGREIVYSSAGEAAVVTSREVSALHWSSDSAHRLVRMDMSVLEAHLRDLVGHSLPRPLRFDIRLDTTSGHGKALVEDVAILVERLERDRAICVTPVAARTAKECLMTRLLLAARHNYQELLQRDPDVRVSRIVEATVELIHEHPDWDHTLVSLAREQMVSTRTLGRQFKRDKGIGPIAYLKQVRLDRVRDVLRASSPETTTVGHVAQVMGFANRAHFAAEYRQRHGELPSETLRR